MGPIFFFLKTVWSEEKIVNDPSKCRKKFTPQSWLEHLPKSSQSYRNLKISKNSFLDNLKCFALGSCILLT